MEKYYLEFLTEFSNCLEKYDSGMWSNWMKKSVELFKQKKDLSHFFRAFGGMGSLSDYYFDDTVATNILYVLEIITCELASYIKNNKNENIKILLNNEKYRYLSKKDITLNEQKQLDYIKYLIDNYELNNLQYIDEKYIINEAKINKGR